MIMIINIILSVWVLGIAIGLLVEFAAPRHKFDTLQHRIAVFFGCQNRKRA